MELQLTTRLRPRLLVRKLTAIIFYEVILTCFLSLRRLFLLKSDKSLVFIDDFVREEPHWDALAAKTKKKIA